MLQTLYDQLMLKVEIEYEKGCWLYKGRINSEGYGVISFIGELFSAHRLMYWLSTGNEIEVVNHIHHKCDNPNCINTSHLEKLTSSEHSLKNQTYQELKEQVMSENLPEEIERALE